MTLRLAQYGDTRDCLTALANAMFAWSIVSQEFEIAASGGNSERADRDACRRRGTQRTNKPDLRRVQRGIEQVLSSLP